MKKQSTSKVLLLPGDAPPRRSTIRRLLLYFDSIVLPDVTDRALINSGEIVEEFSHPTINRIEWGDHGLFPRAPGYDESVAELVSETHSLQTRGLVQFVPRKAPTDPAAWLMSYHAGIADERIVRAAIPDIDPSIKPLVPSTILVGAATAPVGMKSKFDIPFREPIQLADAPVWSTLAWLRIGRAVKYIDRARLLGITPFAADAPNANLCLELAGYSAGTLNDTELADLAIAMDLIDQQELERVLIPLSWNDVLELRRNLLPHLARVRQTLVKSLGGLGLSGGSLVDYRKQVRTLRDKLQAAQSEANKKWRELGLGALLRAGGGVGALTTLETFVVPSSWSDTLLRGVGLALVAGATLTTELRQMYTANRAVRESPLFHIDEIALHGRHAG